MSLTTCGMKLRSSRETHAGLRPAAVMRVVALVRAAISRGPGYLLIALWFAVSPGLEASGALRRTLAQNPEASLSGTVLDETGAAIAQASISVINPNTGLQRAATTDERGYFVIPLLPVGTYVASARMAGFATVTIRDIQIHPSIDVSLEIRLKPRKITETIDVIAGDEGAGPNGTRVSDLDASNAATKHSVTNREVISLPVFANELGRNTLQSLPFLVPGVTPNTTLGALSGLNVAGISVGGSRSSSVSFNIEGGDDNDDEYNQALAALPNPDALQEFTFITSNYQADLGRSAGGVINAAVKSGTAHLSGNVRYLGINDSLNARGFFDPRTPRFRLNNFGGQLGGPAALPFIHGLDDRLFFFADYEGTRSRRESNSSFLVPSVAQRNGNFSGLPLAQQPYDPLTGFNRSTQRQFPGGLIPQDRLDPIAQTYLKLFIPLPNNGDHSFTQLLPTSFANDQAASRLDLKASDRDNVNIIFLAASSRIENPTQYLPVTAQFQQDAGSSNLVLRHTRVLGSAAINEVTAAVTRYDSSVQIFAPGGTGRDPKDVGFIGIHPQTDARLAVPTVYFGSAASSIYAGYGYSSSKTSVQIKDSFSFSNGGHALKFGAEARWYNQQRSYVPVSIDGEFIFYATNPFGSGNDFADFLIGRPEIYYQSTDSSAYPRQSAYQFYGMDDWHITPGVTINVGLRYELTPPPVDRLNQVSAFRPGQDSTVFPSAPAGLIFVGDADPVLGRLPRGLYRTDYRDFAPRVGLAFVPRRAPGVLRHLFGEGKTAIRSGWGMFYDHTALSTSTRISIQTEPFSYSQGLTAPDFANPFGPGGGPWPIDLSKRTFSFYPFVYSVDPSFRTPYTYQYDFTVQRELTPATILELSYVGSASFRTLRDRELNPARVPASGKVAFSILQSRRIYPSIGSIVSAESSGRARSDSFQAQMRHRFTRGLMFQASYVFSKAVDNGGPLSGIPPGPFQWARSPFDRTQNLVVSFSYDIPQLRLRHAADLFSGWRMSGIVEFRSGLPLNIFQASDSTLSGSDPTNRSVPDMTGDFRRIDPRTNRGLIANGVRTFGHFFFDPSAFSTIVPQDFSQARIGNLPRMAFDGPGFNMWSISVGKTRLIVGNHRITVRADIRNLFNHANFDTPISQADSPLFGQVTSAAPGRTIQFSVRYSF